MKMEIEKAIEQIRKKYFVNGDGHIRRQHPLREIDIAFLMVEFAQQNTLTLDLKVDDFTIQEREHDIKISHPNEEISAILQKKFLPYKYIMALKQRLDNEKDLQDIIATQSESIELADKMLRESQDNEKALREGIKELQNKNPYKKAGNRDSYSQYNEGWQDALDYVEQLINY